MRVTVRALNSYEENDKVKVKEKKSSSLIEGNIGKAILLFVLPLIAGSLIQQLYVTVDAIIRTVCRKSGTGSNRFDQYAV